MHDDRSGGHVLFFVIDEPVCLSLGDVVDLSGRMIMCGVGRSGFETRVPIRRLLPVNPDVPDPLPSMRGPTNCVKKYLEVSSALPSAAFPRNHAG